MKSKKLSILLAVIALIISTLACAVGGPTLSNIRTAKDQNGDQPTSVFATTDTVYVISDLSNGVKGNVVSAKWYGVDVADAEPNSLLDQADLTLDEDQSSNTIWFYFAPEGAWTVGSYKIEILLNGTLVDTVEFSIQ